MDLKDKLNFAWKFLFLAIFAYGVFSVTCCSSTSSSCGAQSTKCSKSNVTKPACGADCTKSCCAK